MDSGILPTEVIIPRDATLVDIMDNYGPLAAEVVCGLEGCRTRHKRGFIVSFSHPSDDAIGVGIVGHVCGKNAFGAKWLEAERAYDAKIQAAEMDAARERFLARSGQILPELTAALPRLRTLDEACKVLEKNAAVVMKTCSDAVKSFYGRIKIYSGFEHATLHRLKGEPFWTGDGNALLPALALDTDATGLLDYFSSPDATKKEVAKRLGKLADIEHRWGQITKAMQAAEAALRPSHLQKVFEAVNLIALNTPHLQGVDHGGEWQLYVRMRGTILEVRKWDVLTGATRNAWSPAVDLA